MLLVNQDGVFDLAGFDPGSGSFDAARIFGDGNNFKILALQFAVNFLPT